MKIIDIQRIILILPNITVSMSIHAKQQTIWIQLTIQKSIYA